MPENTLNLELQRSLGRVEGKLDYLITRMTDHFEQDATSFNNLDKRIAGVEKKVWMFAGGFAIVGTLVSQFVAKLIGGHG